MKDNTTIHTLARPRVKSGQIKFICYTDGKEKTFSTCINSLSGDRMSWFNDDPPSVELAIFKRINYPFPTWSNDNEI